MAADNTVPERPDRHLSGSIEELLRPLREAARKRPSGRIRSLPEARSALRIPRSAEADVLKVWGLPHDFQLVAYPVHDRDQPDLVAEFAVLRVIRREGRKLVPREQGARLRLSEKSNLLWVVYGSIVQAADGTLVLESVSIGPAFEGQLSRKGDDIARGVTSQLLRLLSPPRLLAETVERLLQDRHQLERLARSGHKPMPDQQRAVYDRIGAGPRPQGQASEDQIEAIARYYLTLCELGSRHPLPVLASVFGITRTQARDRVHRARGLGYLKRGKQGRVHPERGPRLTQ